jgi:TolB-like protein/class 3 adenylate cyclase/rhodanese-related sulfurtransferase/thioredoxin-like negative regulator of GroEL
MGAEPLERKVAAVLYADVAGYSRLTGEDEEGTHRALSTYLDTLTTSIERHNGKVLHYAGDAVLAEFASVVNALTCAVVIQRDLRARSEHLSDQRKVQFRIGINLGDVIVDRDEIYGDGVNVAARLQSLADPGGVCISDSVRTAIGNKLPLDYEYLGEQEVKNIAEPVRAYRVRLEDEPVARTVSTGSRSRRRAVIASVAVVMLVVMAGVIAWLKPWSPTIEPVSEELAAVALPGKPSIAVLPFANMSGDAEQEYFTDGMTDDLITDLSKVSGLFVIGRNSVFTYKGKSVKISQVAEELGVRYVLEGSVRRRGEQVRINAQLIDATTGGHVWAERYDGPLDDIFALQDKVTRRIVTALAVNLTSEEEANRARVKTKNPKAYVAFLQGWEHYRRGTPADFAEAVSYFKQAIGKDPNYGRAYSALAAVYWNSVRSGWWINSLGLTHTPAREQTRRYLQKAMENPSALTHQVASEMAAYDRPQPGEALAEAKRAIAVDTNDPAGYLAMATALLKAGRPTEAMESVRKAMSLDPHYPASYLMRLAQAEFALGQYEDAAATLERAASRNPDNDWTFVYLAAAYGHLGRAAEAKTALDKANALRAKAGWGALTLQTVDHPYFRWVGDRKPLREGLLRAGVAPGNDWAALVTTGPSGYQIKGAATIDVKTTKALHDRGVPFVDVYRRWPQGHIPGAYFRELWTGEFNEVRLFEIVDKTEEVVIYSSGGDGGGVHRSAADACAQALTWGFQKVYCFAEGFPGWKAAGYPAEKSG